MKLFTFLILFLPSILLADGNIIFFKGNITHQRRKVLKKLIAVKVGDTIETSKKSFVVVKLKDKSILKLGSNSKIVIEALQSKKSPTIVNLLKGSIISKINEKYVKKEKFVVKTRYASMGVRGTKFYTSLGKDNKDTWMCVNEGLVEVRRSNSTDKKLVKAGEGVHILSNKKLPKPSFLPWTQKINWNMDPKLGKLENKIEIKDAYQDLLDRDYD